MLNLLLLGYLIGALLLLGMSILSSFGDVLGRENPKIGYVHYARRDLFWLSIWLQHLCSMISIFDIFVLG